MAYKQFIEQFRNGVTDIGLSQDGSVTVTFATKADNKEWISIEPDGEVNHSFDRAARSVEFLEEYLDLAVNIARMIQRPDGEKVEYAVEVQGSG
jgi:hypothetical protein